MHVSIAQALYFPLQYFRREPVLKIFHELEKSQWFSRDKLEYIQFKKMKNLIEFSYKEVPLYKNIYTKAGVHPNDIKQPTDTKLLPVLDREILQANLSELVGKKIPYYPAKTAGTTGQSLSLKVDNISWAYHHANIFRTLSWYGVAPRAPEARIWGRRIDVKERRRIKLKDLIFNRSRLNAFDIEREAVRFAKKLRKSRPHYLYGYPSTICQFIECLEHANIKVPPLKVVACTADQLTRIQKQLIEGFFNAKVTDIYGAAEVGIIASQCPEGGRHIPIESIWVDIEKEEEIARGEKSGEVIVTDLNNYSMPIIRYSIGDRCYLESAQCSCGRNLPVMKDFLGRRLEFIETPDGRRVTSAFVYYLFKGLEARGVELQQYQLIREKIDKFDIMLVTSHLKKLDREYLTKTLKYYIGNSIDISIKIVGHIPPLPSGKHAIYINNNLS